MFVKIFLIKKIKKFINLMKHLHHPRVKQIIEYLNPQRTSSSTLGLSKLEDGTFGSLVRLGVCLKCVSDETGRLFKRTNQTWVIWYTCLIQVLTAHFTTNDTQTKLKLQSKSIAIFAHSTSYQCHLN